MTTNLKIDRHLSNCGDSHRLEDEDMALDDRDPISARQPAAVPAILIIDDEQKVLDVLTNALAKVNCRLTTSSSGTEGIELACREKFDLILLDLGLPDIAGFDVLKALKVKVESLPATGSQGTPNVSAGSNVTTLLLTRYS